MAEIDADTRDAWRKNPDDPVDIIVRVSGDLNELGATLEKRGAEVKRRLRLTHSLSIRCRGKLALQLLDEPWVARVEVDRSVKALRR
jgi:hypothetical protein